MDYREDLFYTSLFKTSFFLAKTLFFQSALLNSVRGKSLCTHSFLAFMGLSLTENLRIKKKKKKNRQRSEERNQMKACEVTQSTLSMAGNPHFIDMGKDAKKWS